MGRIATWALALLSALGCEAAQRSASSQFVSSFSAQLQRLGDARLLTLACLGPRDSGKGVLLGKVLGTSVAEEGELEAVLSADRKVAIFNTPGFGEAPSAAGAEEGTAAQDTAVAVALSDVLVVTVFFREFISSPLDALGKLAELRPAMELLLRVSREPGAVAPRKRKLILLVRDFEPDEGVSEAQLRARLVAQLEQMWAGLLAQPSGPGSAAPAAPPAISDILDVRLALIPLAKLDASAFSAALAAFRAAIADAVAQDSPLAATDLASALALVSKVAAQASAGQALRAPAASAAELAAALACARAANAAFDEYVSATSDLHARALARDRREPLLTLASEGSAALGAALASYDAATSAHAGLELCAKRRANLEAAILNDLRPLYSENLQLCLKMSVIEFARRSANATQADVSNFARNLQATVDDVSSGFRAKAAALCLPEAAGSWSSALEQRMLEQELQSMSGEMLRRAQLHGLYAPPAGRVPTGIALHWLHPNPFGKDMRNDQLTASDRLSYSARAKELLRSSPMRMGNAASAGGSDSGKLSASAFSGGIKLTEEDLVIQEDRRRR